MRSAENRSLRPASCCSVEVMNGAYGLRVYGFSSTLDTRIWTPVSAWASRVASASASTVTAAFALSLPSEPKSRPVATRVPSTATRRAPKIGGSAPLPASMLAATSQ